MKKLLLIASLSAALAVPAAMAQNPDDGQHTENLKLVWYGVPTGTAANANDARSGIGVNGKFYVVLQNKGVEVYDNSGKIKTITNSTAWVSINCDDAGHVYFRNDIAGWPGADGGGWMVQNNARFCVIDSKTDEVIKSDVSMTNSIGKCRFDALPHIMGNMMVDGFEIAVPNNGAGNRISEFIFSPGLEIEQIGYNIVVTDAIKMFPSPANGVQTLGSAQLINGGDNMVCLPNNHINITSSLNGWGNNIIMLDLDPDTYEYSFKGKYLNTPNHSSVGGFMVFEYDGVNYVVYPTGMYSVDSPAGDGFFVTPLELVDSPQNTTPTQDPQVWADELHKAVAFHYATEGIQSAFNYRGINVEPVDGKPGVFNLYFFNPGKSMQMWELDLTEAGAGIGDLVADNGNARIFGGAGAVIVDGADHAAVYTFDGRLVAQGRESIPVAAGVYIVKAGTTVAKVIVK